MDWRIKASLQKIFSTLKFGNEINHLGVTLRGDYHRNSFTYHFHECFRKLEYCRFKSYLNLKALEIGTGYTLIQPIILSLCGFESITTVDITKDVKLKDIKKQVSNLNDKYFQQILYSKSSLENNQISERIKFILDSISLSEILERLNINYIAPYRVDKLPSSNFYDYIFSQVVLEHVKPEDIKELFDYFSKVLSSNGVSVHTINFVDHFTNPGFFSDTKISEFNFLKYTDEYWANWTNNDIAYVNRLSYPYYIQLCEHYGFKLINFIGENYKQKKPFNINEIHTDIIKKYNSSINLEDLIKYQRGTIIFRK